MKFGVLGCLLLLKFVLLDSDGIQAQSSEDTKLMNRVKAAFVFNFAKFVKWPEAEEADVFRVGILGRSWLTAPLREISKQKKVRGKAFEVKVFKSEDTVGPCELLIVTRDRLTDF